MDPQVYAKKRFAETVPAMAWKPQPKEEMVKWQKALRKQLRHLLGGLEEPRTPIKAEVHETRDFGPYRRESVRFESRPGLEVFGYFLLPKTYKPGTRLPTVLCLEGHGRGVDCSVGIAENGSQRAWGDWGEYQADFPLQCVANGYAAFAIEQISFGKRRDAEAQRSGGGSSSCTRDSAAALMLGETMTGWRVWDAIRSLDYLTTRPEVDSRRLATMGISGGGLASLFTACVDERVHTCIVSGYLNTFRDSILAVNHCVDNYVPGLLKVAEMPDLIGLIAPRPLFAESGRKDPIFPLHGFEKAVAQGRQIYAAFGVPAHFDSEVFEGEHQFHGVGAFRFLKEHFG